MDLILKRMSTLRTYDEEFLELIYLNTENDISINVDKIGSRYYLVFNSEDSHLSISCADFTIDGEPFKEELL